MRGDRRDDRRSSYSIVVISVLVLSALLPLLAPVQAHEPDPPESSGNPDVQVENSKNVLILRTHLKANSSDDEFKLQLGTKNGLKLYLSLNHAKESVETMITFSFEFLCMAGASDTEDALSAGCGDDDRVVRKFSNMVFGEIEYQKCTSCEEPVHKIDVSSKDGKFKLKFEVVADFSKDDGTVIPRPVAMQVWMKYFEFAKEDQSLALKLKVSSNVQINVKEGLEGQSGGVVKEEERAPGSEKDDELGEMFLSYSKKAEVDGSEKDVASDLSTDSKDGSTIVTLAYPKGESISHDLQMFVNPTAIVLKGDVPLYAATIGVVAAIFALTDKRVLARLRGKGK